MANRYKKKYNKYCQINIKYNVFVTINGPDINMLNVKLKKRRGNTHKRQLKISKKKKQLRPLQMFLRMEKKTGDFFLFLLRNYRNLNIVSV